MTLAKLGWCLKAQRHPSSRNKTVGSKRQIGTSAQLSGPGVWGQLRAVRVQGHSRTLLEDGLGGNRKASCP